MSKATAISRWNDFGSRDDNYGYWVRHDDHERALSASEAEVARLREALEKVLIYFTDQPFSEQENLHKSIQCT